VTALLPKALPPRPPAPAGKSCLAIFDLDGTLVKGDTFLPFLVTFARRRRRVWPLLAMLPLLALYGLGLLSARRAKERLLSVFLRGEDEDIIKRHAERFARGWVSRRLRDDVVSRLREHQAQGHRVILLSASPDIYVGAVARVLRIAEMVATRVLVASGRCQGRIVGDNIKGDAKLAALKAYLQEEVAPPDSFAYGDSDSDLPTLRWVAHGIRV
jgi:phosphatidylglycerophosphatase C